MISNGTVSNFHFKISEVTFLYIGYKNRDVTPGEGIRTCTNNVINQCDSIVIAAEKLLLHYSEILDGHFWLSHKFLKTFNK